ERIDTIEIPDRDGGVAIRIERAAFRSTNGIDLPRSLRIEAMRPSLRVDARLTAAGPDPGTDPGRFRLPKPASFRRLTDRELVRILQEGAEGR
ncbi:MAG: hypothetical protein QUU85_03555, partial [Candidatus Eisenbacteria bacterium]|nr:hypothetical protein [Candidatus Eisenbacteria bacterium]